MEEYQIINIYAEDAHQSTYVKWKGNLNVNRAYERLAKSERVKAIELPSEGELVKES